MLCNLPKGKYETFKALAKNAAKEDILKLLGMVDSSDNPKMADYVSAVLHESIAVNEKLFDEKRGAGIITEAIERVFIEEIDKRVTEETDKVIVNS